MARFILDVNSKNSYKMSIKQIDEICQSINEQLLNGEIFRIVCIDDTTDNQFYEKLFCPNSIFYNFKYGQKSFFELGKCFKTAKKATSQMFFLDLFDFTSFFAWTF